MGPRTGAAASTADGGAMDKLRRGQTGFDSREALPKCICARSRRPDHGSAGPQGRRAYPCPEPCPSCAPPYTCAMEMELLVSAQYWAYRLGAFVVLNVLDDPAWLALIFC